MSLAVDTSRPSPNFDSGRSDQVRLVLLHATVGPLASSLNWLCAPASRVSSHYLISKTGHIYQLVRELDTAWHAGRAVWHGFTNVNDISIGIELENANDGHDPYPDAQVKALTDLVRDILARHHLTPQDIATHAQVALPAGRKSDPAGFPFAAWVLAFGRHYRVKRYGTVPRQSRDPGALPAAAIPPGTTLVIDDVTNGWAHVGAGDAAWGQIGFCPIGDLEAV